jgi:hypothetical protein
MLLINLSLIVILVSIGVFTYYVTRDTNNDEHNRHNGHLRNHRRKHV